MPIKISLKSCVTHEYDPQEVLKVFEALNFRSLRDRLVKVATPTQKSMFPDMIGEKAVRDADVADMDSDGHVMAVGAVVAASDVVETVIVRDQTALDDLVAVLNAATDFAVDTETTSIDAMLAELVGISLSVDGKTAYYIPVGHREGQQLPLQVVVDALRPLFVDPAKPKYLHNVPYDLVVLCQHGLDLFPVAVDTMVANGFKSYQPHNLDSRI